ncbi:MerR family transcriptional regulator [Pseudoroseicyclus aestuarii]|uniref:MerR family transcriptional regulator n=1 Tax=Pseudoroseicyclus aestuarii TaxID=1795041 RepID=A0A318T5R2_9RHOB|nr:helix-turn-helix domain-containing protein [Pseudoroseicyclus aestuarii]PYE83698.1 MerR family transcriptional regulator [Pseudoroseicyclus aestuarii]
MFSIGELAARTGLKVQTIRWYEGQGLIEEPARTEGGQRRYDEEGLRRLAFIKHARDLGLPLDSVRALIALQGREGAPCDGAHRIAAEHLEALRERIARLQRLEAELARIAAIDDAGEAGNCRVLDAFADHGACRAPH